MPSPIAHFCWLTPDRNLPTAAAAARFINFPIMSSLVPFLTRSSRQTFAMSSPSQRLAALQNQLSARSLSSSAPVSSGYSVRRIAPANTLDHRVFLEHEGKPVSPFHDIPLVASSTGAGKVFNMVVEVPRWTNAKLEISKSEALNPIVQDTKKGKLRFVRNCFPYKGYIHNYGAFPQTWEDPSEEHINPDTGARGDNDPLDVCEIGEAVGYTGQVKQVKVLGVMALLDEGETDWKILAIDVNDPIANDLNSIADIEKHQPGLLNATYEWFRTYKMPDGKPANEFAFGGAAKDRDYALNVVEECHEAWKKLTADKVLAEKHEINLANKDSGIEVPADQDLPAAPIDASIGKWFFVS